MKVGTDIIELFKGNNKFSQILFLDNFYNKLDIQEYTGSELEAFLFPLLDISDLYIKRTCLGIISELCLIGKLNNTYRLLSVFDIAFETEDDPFILSICLKYFPLIAERFSQKDKNRFIQLTDHGNSDVSSEAHFALGLMELSAVANNAKGEDIIQSLLNSTRHFQESSNVSENRTDAIYICHLIAFIQAFMANNETEAGKELDLARNIFILRQVYELNEIFVEFDLIVFRIFQKMFESMRILHDSNRWVDYKQELFKLIRVNKQIEKLKRKSERSKEVVSKVYNAIIKKSVDILYSSTFIDDKRRIERITEEGENTELVYLSNQILSVLPKNNDDQEDIGLLASIIEIYGKEKGMQYYNMVKNNQRTILDVIIKFPQRNFKSSLGFITGSILGQEAYKELANELEAVLPNYNKDKLLIFFEILEEIIRYTRNTIVESSKSEYLFLYSSREGGLGAAAKEIDLQNHLFKQLKLTSLAYGFEHEKAKFVDGGRVDIVFKIDMITI